MLFIICYVLHTLLYISKNKFILMEKKLFDFIKLKTPNLKEVLDVKNKNYDDDNGFIDEHYEVRCLLKVADTTIPIGNNLGEQEKICLVDKQEFNKWVKQENSIKWI